MEKKPVSDTKHRLAEPNGNEILSIQLRPDGLSFAYLESGEIRSAVLNIPEEKINSGFDFTHTHEKWPQKAFTSVQVCVPTDYALVIPVTLNRPEHYKPLFASLGFPEEPGATIMALDCVNERVLLHAVCNGVSIPLTERYAERLEFIHPLFISLNHPEEKSTTLSVDVAGGYGSFVLSKGKELLFADVLPVKDDAALLLAVNRIIVNNKVGTCRIICSGDECKLNADLLSHHYQEVNLHPLGENRNLYFPLLCE